MKFKGWIRSIVNGQQANFATPETPNVEVCYYLSESSKKYYGTKYNVGDFVQVTVKENVVTYTEKLDGAVDQRQGHAQTTFERPMPAQPLALDKRDRSVIWCNSLNNAHLVIQMAGDFEDDRAIATRVITVAQAYYEAGCRVLSGKPPIPDNP